MKLAVVIVNYNVKYFLEQCLRSVFAAIQSLDAEVYVVDNNSKDGSVEWIRNKFPQVHLIANKENVGFSKANNQAIRQTNAEWVLLLNPDTVVPEDCFISCISYAENHPKLGGLGIRMVDGTGHYLPESKRGLPTPEVALYKMTGLGKLFPKSERFGAYYLGHLSDEIPQKVSVLAGAFMMMRKSVLDEIGLLDETYFMYGEDIDLSHRIHLAGYENHYLPNTPIIHYKGESTRKESYHFVRAFYGAMIIFARRYFSKGQAAMLTFMLYPAIIGKAIWAYLSVRIQKSLLPIFDVFIIWLIFYLLEGYWEANIKSMDGIRYPKIFLLGFVPTYIGIWLFTAFLSGGYDRPFKPWKFIRGLGIGVVITLAAYGLLDEQFRFSRGMLLVGGFLGSVSLISFRWLLQLFGLGNWKSEKTSEKRTIIVGSELEVERTLGLLQKSHVELRYLGFLDETGSNNALDSWDSLLENCTNIPIDQIIFCGKDLKNHQIISWMIALKDLKISFKIIPMDSDFVIGAQSVETPGVLYSKEFHLPYYSASNKRRKRILDLILCGLLPLTSKGLKTKKFGRLWIQVLVGKANWVGVEAPLGLPQNKPFLWHYSQSSKSKFKTTLSQEYLRYWTISMDWKTIWR